MVERYNRVGDVIVAACRLYCQDLQKKSENELKLKEKTTLSFEHTNKPNIWMQTRGCKYYKYFSY